MAQLLLVYKKLLSILTNANSHRLLFVVNIIISLKFHEIQCVFYRCRCKGVSCVYPPSRERQAQGKVYWLCPTILLSKFTHCTNAVCLVVVQELI